MSKSLIALRPPQVLISYAITALLVTWTVGCTSVRQYVHNGFKVGPNYATPAAPVAASWIDSDDSRVRTSRDDLCGWWTVFDDPTLNMLIEQAHGQNLTLREAGFRILAARAQFGFAAGNLFPQLQTGDGAYRRLGVSDTFFDQWSLGFSLVWELDFWGRYRRALQAAEATLDASVEDYDAVLVTLLADVANNYVSYRTAQERIRLLNNTITVQEGVLAFINEQLEAGNIDDVDRAQASANLSQSRAALYELEIQLRQAQNNLCILMGIPITDLSQLLDIGRETMIPVAPDFVVVGIPADLLRRRPDVRAAERTAAAQAEQIGIAAVDFYPAISLSGTLGWQAQSLSELFDDQSLNASVGPGFQWNLLNYGRLRNNVRFQEAQFQQLVAAYQSTVLQADLEVENGIVAFLNSQQRAENLRFSVEESNLALQVVIAQYEAGLAGVNFDRYALIVQNLIQQQDSWAQARGQIAFGLIEVYRALGGGWQIRLGAVPDKQGILSPLPQVEEVIPVPDAAEALPPIQLPAE